MWGHGHKTRHGRVPFQGCFSYRLSKFVQLFSTLLLTFVTPAFLEELFKFFSVFPFQFQVSLINNDPFSSLFMPGDGTNRSDQNYIPHLSPDVCSRKCAINVSSFLFLFFFFINEMLNCTEPVCLPANM